ncbi:MAG: tetratricopeptide repeat protein [Deltaproteobacteria bacterium]
MTRHPTERTVPKSAYLIFAAVSLLTLAVFAPAVGNEFINWDDSVYAFANPNLQKIDAAFFKWIFFTVDPGIGNWIPLTLLTHAIDFMVWGTNPWGPHLLNVIIHSANTFLVGLVAFKLVRLAQTGADTDVASATGAALFTALVFGIHPLRVESVAWVSERKDLLCALFFLLSVNSYTSFASARAGRVRHYAVALIFALLALLSKPMAVSLPFVLLIIDLYPLERFSKTVPDAGKSHSVLSIFYEKIPFFALSALASLAALLAQSSSRAISDVGVYPVATRVWMSLNGYAFYLYKTIWPTDLSTFYPHPVSINPASIEFAGSAALFIFITILCALTFKKQKAFTAVWLYYTITLLPVIGIVKVGAHSVADRYTYLPLIAPVLLAGIFFGRAFTSHSRIRRSLGIICVATVTLILGWLTVNQTAIWKDSITFWSRAIDLYPGVSPLPYMNRALAYDDAGRGEEAIADYDAALALKPGSVEAYNNRALIKAAQGAYAEAIADYNRAIEIDPSYAIAYNNRGLAYRSIGDTEKAIEDLKRAIEIDRGMTAAYRNLAEVYAETGDMLKAAEAASGQSRP